MSSLALLELKAKGARRVIKMADQSPYPGTPRWVKISFTIVGLLLLLAVALMASGVGGPHGPGRHLSSPDTEGQPPLAGDCP